MTPEQIELLTEEERAAWELCKDDLHSVCRLALTRLAEERAEKKKDRLQAAQECVKLINRAEKAERRIAELERELQVERHVSATLAEKEVSQAIRREEAERQLSECREALEDAPPQEKK